ncbi:MAG TPA: glycosyltransferase family 39 protein [Solirubrobacteraceae bacterium]|jgi:mannosyltransferase|nr:glycosyltransferase family 39 protein [Solirubrobacteraceae bacterium]
MAHASALPTEDRPAARGGARAPGRAALDRERLLGMAVIAIPCAIAAVLAFYDITGRSLWLDEAASVAIASQHGAALWHAIEHDGGNMLAYYAFLHVVIGLFGDGVLAIRIASALATVATVGVTVVLAKRLFDARVAFAAGVLTAASLTLVYWGQDARSYALMMTFAVASYLAFAALVEGGPRARWVWLAYVVATVLAAYMSFEAVLIVPAQLLSLVWRERRPLRSVAWAVAVAAACCLPLLVLAERRGSGQLFWVPKPNFTQLHQMLEALLSAGLQPNFHLTPTGTPLLLFTGVLVLAVIGAMLRGRRASWQEMLVLCWLAAPIALALLESVVVQPITLARVALLSVPAASILIAQGTLSRRVPRLLGLGVIAVLLVLRGLELAPSYGASPENWRAATAHVLAAARPGDCIAFYPEDGRQAFSYYIAADTGAAARAPRSVLPALPWSEVRPFVENYTAPRGPALASIEAGCPRLWFVSSHRGQKSGPPASRTDYARYVALLGSLSRAYPAGSSVSYGWASPVRVELFSRCAAVRGAGRCRCTTRCS